MWQMANSNKKTLSKNLTQMKFMKRRSQDPTDRLLIDSSAGALIEKWIVPDIPHTDGENLEHGSCHQCVESFVECEGLNQFGRFSFNKFNREVERLAQHYSNGGKSSAHGSDLLDDDEDGTIPAREMAKRYEEITSRKLLGKRKRSGQLEIRDDNDDVMMTSASTDDVDDNSEATSSSSKPPPEKKSLRHRELQKRLDKKTEKRGFLKPS